MLEQPPQLLASFFSRLASIVISGVSSEVLRVLEHPPQLLASFFSRLASIVIYLKADHLASSLILHSQKEQHWVRVQ